MNNLRERIKNHLKEVRYIKNKNIDKEEPLKDAETIRVFHGFNKFDEAINVLVNGLSGKERAKRIYSYESGNNPYGLFVTVDLNIIKRGRFAHSGVIIEFSTKVSDLEAPVWVGGRSYFVQGEYTKSFKDLEEREQQRLINRQKAGESPYDMISKSDRPELAQTIFDNPERQALYIGDLNPNMIKAVWYNEKLHKERLLNGEWVRLSRKDFMTKININTKDIKNWAGYLPNDEFDYDDFVQRHLKLGFDLFDIRNIFKYNGQSEYDLKEMGFFPKQIKKIMQMHKDGAFD